MAQNGLAKGIILFDELRVNSVKSLKISEGGFLASPV
jgi:hypothetical protein